MERAPSSGPRSLSPGVGPVTSLAVTGSQEVPFKGRFEGTQTLTPQQPPFAFVNGSATGNATHLGRFTVTFPIR